MRIDREFKQLIPALTNDEVVLLESNILADGCRDPLTVWQEESVLLDGHNRYDICSKHDIEFDVNYISLPSRQHAINWIINNQLGRRNVTPDQASYLRGKRYNMEKEDVGGTGANQYGNNLQKEQNVPTASTAERLADEFKVSHMTIKRDGKFADAIDSLSDVMGDNVRQAVLSGDSKIPKQDVISAAAWMKQNDYKPPVRQSLDDLSDDLSEDEEGYDWLDGGTDGARSPSLPDVVQKIKLAAANHATSDTPGYDGDEWYTPKEYIDAARRVMGDIDLDPASCLSAQTTVKANKYYTKDDDSLRDDVAWSGRVWLNPPYSMPLIAQFVEKIIDQYELGNITEAIIITNNSSDTSWFHELFSRYPACFTRGRVKFWRPNHENFGTRQGQTLFYLGENKQGFQREFSQFGIVAEKVSY